MVILISPEETSTDEIDILHQLFETGLTHFHFRKPNASLDEHRIYLNQIDVKFHQYIMTHNFHTELTSEYTIKGVHLEERKWRAESDNLEKYVADFKKNEFTVSSSYHEPEDLAAQPVVFDYYLLSPVFSAISKSDMKGRGFDVHGIPKLIVGMGGINAETTPKAIALGFHGIGVLGGVWNSDDPLSSFKEVRNAFTSAVS